LVLRLFRAKLPLPNPLPFLAYYAVGASCRGGRDVIEGLISCKLDAPQCGQAAIQPLGVSSFMLCSALRRIGGAGHTSLYMQGSGDQRSQT
jgi:hypothetical protein